MNNKSTISLVFSVLLMMTAPSVRAEPGGSSLYELGQSIVETAVHVVKEYPDLVALGLTVGIAVYIYSLKQAEMAALVVKEPRYEYPPFWVEPVNAAVQPAMRAPTPAQPRVIQRSLPTPGAVSFLKSNLGKDSCRGMNSNSFPEVPDE